jgi:flagellar hook assembly protein FlgD
LSASPNPFRDHVDFEWRRATTGRAVIEVFDTVGRRVRRFDAELSEGRVRWDGTDEKGSRVPAGLYFSRLTDDRGSQSVRILHLR